MTVVPSKTPMPKRGTKKYFISQIKWFHSPAAPSLTLPINIVIFDTEMLDNKTGQM